MIWIIRGSMSPPRTLPQGSFVLHIVSFFLSGLDANITIRWTCVLMPPARSTNVLFMFNDSFVGLKVNHMHLIILPCFFLPSSPAVGLPLALSRLHISCCRGSAVCCGWWGHGKTPELPAPRDIRLSIHFWKWAGHQGDEQRGQPDTRGRWWFSSGVRTATEIHFRLCSKEKMFKAN